jgi:hypothetical protein
MNEPQQSGSSIKASNGSYGEGFGQYDGDLE